MLPKPNQKIKVTSVDPNRMFIFSHPKTGKTSLACGLPNHLLIDIEGGSTFVEGTKINVKNYAVESGISTLEALKRISDEIKAANSDAKKKIYDYIIIDTATALEGMAKDLGSKMYKASAMGKNWKGGDIYNLPNGAGCPNSPYLVNCWKILKTITLQHSLKRQV